MEITGWGDLWWRCAERTPFCRSIVTVNRPAIIGEMILYRICGAVEVIASLLDPEGKFLLEKGHLQNIRKYVEVAYEDFQSCYRHLRDVTAHLFSGKKPFGGGF
jgi:hypothetical protein